MLILLDNDLKYSADEVQLEAVASGLSVKIKVRDSRKGIPTDEMDNIFDRCYRAEDNAFIPGIRLG